MPASHTTIVAFGPYSVRIFTSMLGEVTSAIGRAGGSIGAVDIVQSHEHQVVRDIAVDARSRDHWDEIIAAVNEVEGVQLLDWTDRTFKMHEGGKIAQLNKHP